MRISFELTADDVVASYLLNHDHTQPMTRWLVRAIGLLISFCSLMKLIQLFLSDAGPTWDQIGTLSLSVVLFPLVPWLYPRWMSWNARRHVQPDQLGTCTMEISGTRLLTRTRFSEGAIEIHQIKNIVVFKNYALIYLGSVMQVIPFKNVLAEEDYRAFVAALRQVWETGDDGSIAKSEHISKKSSN